MTTVAVNIHNQTDLLADTRLELGRLHDPDAMPNQRPGRGFVWRIEEDRAKPKKALLDAANDGVSLADRREP